MVEQQSQDRQPTPDPAENDAFFPSPYSLSQYTSVRTDFDGLTTPRDAYSGAKKVLVIATEERYMLMRNGTMFSTGNHPVETLLPLHHIVEAGFDVEVATLTGAPAKFEWWAFPTEDDAVIETWQKLRDQFKSPTPLSEVVQNRLGPDSEYLGVFIPGGHGAMNQIPESVDVRAVLDWALAEDRLIVSLCHGPAAFLAAGVGRDRNPLAGYQICAFPDSLDQGANIEIGYLPGEMPWALGKRLLEAGLTIVNQDMSGATHRDRNVITGDSPLASHQLGKMTTHALLDAVNQAGE